MIRRTFTVTTTALLAWVWQTAALAQGETLYVNEWVAVWGSNRITQVRFLVDGMDCLKQKSFNPTRGEWPEVGPGGAPLKVKSDTCIPTALDDYLQQADRRFGDQISLTLPGDHGFIVFEAASIDSALSWCQDYAATLRQSLDEPSDATRQDWLSCALAPAAD